MKRCINIIIKIMWDIPILLPSAYGGIDYLVSSRNHACSAACVTHCLKGHSGADWPVFFSRSIKSLIYSIFTYKVWTLNFHRKGQKFEVSFWRWEIPDYKLCREVSRRPLGGDFIFVRIATIRRLIHGKTSAYCPRLKAIRFRHLNSVL